MKWVTVFMLGLSIALAIHGFVAAYTAPWAWCVWPFVAGLLWVCIALGYLLDLLESVDGMDMEEARGIAARCWCDPRVENRQMDVEMAEVFAEALVKVANGEAEDD